MTDNSTIIRPYLVSDKPALMDLIDLNTPKYFAVSEKYDFENYLEKERELYYVISLENKIVTPEEFERDKALLLKVILDESEIDDFRLFIQTNSAHKMTYKQAFAEYSLPPCIKPISDPLF